MEKTFEFSSNDSASMAKFVAELTKQGIEYEVENIIGGWRIHITGGF